MSQIDKKSHRHGVNDYSSYKEPVIKTEADKMDVKIASMSIFFSLVMAASNLIKYDNDVEYNHTENPINKVSYTDKKVNNVNPGAQQLIGKINNTSPSIGGRDVLLSVIKSSDDDFKSSQQYELQLMAEELSNKWRINKERSLTIVEHVEKAAEMQNLPPSLIYAVIAKESSFNVHAKSVVGAMGLMQINYKWHKDKISKDDVYDPEKNIQAGAAILREYIDKENGDVALGLQRYNGSKFDKTRKYSKAVLAYMDNFIETNMRRKLEVGEVKMSAGATNIANI